MNFRQKLRFLIDGILIILFTFFVAYITNRSGYLALGGDGYAHVTKIKFIADFFPNFHWVYFWGNGIPVFLWYGFMPYAFLVFFYKVFGTAVMAINSVNLLTFIMIGIGIYGIVYEVTQSRLASLLAAFLALPLPGLWYRIMVGTTTRTFGDGFMVLSIWFLVKALREERKEVLRFSTLLGLIIFTSLAFQSHFFTTLLTGFFDFFIIIFVAREWGERIKFLFLTFLPAFLLATYFLVPFLLTEHMTQASASFGLFEAEPLNLKLLFYHPPEVVVIPGGGLLPIHLPLLIVLLPSAFLLGKLKDKDFAKRITLVFSCLFFCFLMFGVAIYFGYPATWYNTGFVPDEAFEFFSIIIPVLLGILFWLIFSSRLLKAFFIMVVLVLVGLVIWQYPIRYPLQAQVPFEFDAHTVYDENLIWKLLEGQAGEKNYRYGHPATEISLWFNFDSKIPQNREFFPHGVMYPNWRSWQENAIWNPEWDEKMEETKFLFDWFSIRWFSLLPPGFNLNKEKYVQDSDFEMRVANPAAAETGFEFKKATLILSATNTPAILVIGEKSKDTSFGPIVRILASQNLNSQMIIPVRGQSTLDSYRLEELVKFPLIFLYEYRIKNPQKAGKLILDYLSSGGKVVLESTSFVPDGKKQIFEKVLGFESNPAEAKEGKWNFSPAQSSLTEGIDFSQFSPPLFEGAPWKYLYIKKASLGEDKKQILLNDDRIVIFQQKVEGGELIWSGLNLPYHTLSYQNQEEVEFLVNMIFGLLKTNRQVLPRLKSTVQFINPQERVVEIHEPTKAILFKENYFFNWQAILEKDGKKEKLKVYPAGLDFMYIPFNESMSSGKVTIFYRRSLVEQASTAISLFSLIALLVIVIGYLKLGSIKFKNYSARLKEKSVGRLTRWWQKEDEE